MKTIATVQILVFLGIPVWRSVFFTAYNNVDSSKAGVKRKMDTSRGQHHPLSRYSSRVSPILKRPEKRHVDEKIVLSPIHSCWKSNLLYRHLGYIDSVINSFRTFFKNLLWMFYILVLKRESQTVIVYNEIFIKGIKWILVLLVEFWIFYILRYSVWIFSGLVMLSKT